MPMLSSTPTPTPRELPRDILGLLLQTVDAETGESYDDTQIRNEIMTFLLAGHETTAVMLTFLAYELSRHPEAEEKLRKELREVVGDRPVQWEDLKDLKYMTAALKESLRLYPPISGVGLQTVNDDVIGGVFIPAGTHINSDFYSMHRRPELYPQPEEFIPDRFLDPETPDVASFSMGPRSCIGQSFAMLEGKAILATLMQSYSWKLQDGFRMDMKKYLTLRPDGNVLPVVLTKL